VHVAAHDLTRVYVGLIARPLTGGRLSLLELAARLVGGSHIGQVPRLGDEHDAGAAVTEHAMNGIDGALHDTYHVSVERRLAKPLQA